MLTGEPPFSGEALELALHHLHDPPPRPSSRTALPRAVDEVVGALMAKDPAVRPMPLGHAIDAMTGAGLRRRGRRWLAAVVGAVAIGGALAAVLAWPRGTQLLRAPMGLEQDETPTTIVDASGATLQTLPAIGRAAMSPDERVVAGVWDRWLIVHELATGTRDASYRRQVAAACGRAMPTRS